jgi:acetylornithine deacetylase
MADVTTATGLLADLVAFPSVSADGNAAIAAHCAERLADLGAEVEWMPDATGERVNIWARIGPDAPGGLILSGHLDVVPVDGQDWASDPWRLAERDGRLHGRGTCDMKGFVACVLATLGTVDGDRLAAPIWVALTHDEEVGMHGAQRLVATLADREVGPAMALIGEPTGMGVVEAHKGCCEYTVTFRGRAGHGSAPERGVNAVLAASRYAGELLAVAGRLRARKPASAQFDPPWPTVNIGRLSGGSAHNVIPDRAELMWDMRPHDDADRAFILDGIGRFVDLVLRPEMQARAPEAEIATETVGDIAALGASPENRLRDLLIGLGCPAAPAVAFGTEAGLFQSLGCDTVVCGPGHIAQAHQADEYVDRAELARCLQVLAALPDALRERRT